MREDCGADSGRCCCFADDGAAFITLVEVMGRAGARALPEREPEREPDGADER